MTDDFLTLAIGNGSEVSGLSLDALEVVIERGQQTFIEVGRALMEIRDRRLYRETHATFEAYCGERWGWTARRGYQLIAAAKAVEAGDVNHGSQTERAVRGELSGHKARKSSEPIRRPKRETPDEHAQVIELVRRQLTDLREQYAIVTYWQPVWAAIDELNKGIK